MSDRDRLLAILDRFDRTRIAVVADIIVDEFVHGEISRVSREAPVLILKHKQSRIVPGGGGNAICNLRSLGARPVPFGCVGRDEGGDAVLRAFRGAGIVTRHIARVGGRATTHKTRILASLPHSNLQQVLRIDREEPLSPPPGAIEAYLSGVLPSCRGLLVSDYGLGCVPPALSEHAAIRSFAGPVTVDSRHQILRFTHLTAATPNEGEVEAALGVRIGEDPAALVRAGRRMLRMLRSKAVLVTRGNKGMSLFEAGRDPCHLPIHGSEEIADVTGAGDTVIATFTLALSCGASYLNAARLANFAGGIVVMKRGTATVSREELARAIRDAYPE